VTTLSTQLAPRRGVSSYHPLCKIALLLLAILVASAVTQAAAWLIGLDFSLLSFDRGARTALLLLSLVLVLALMQADGRSAADLGLTMSEGWWRRFLIGLTAGCLTFGAYGVLAWSLGAVRVSGQRVAWSSIVSALAASMAAVPVAAIQLIVFAGYVHRIFRDRYRPATTLLIGAGVTVLFGSLSLVGDAAAFGAAPLARRLIGLYLIALLMGCLRVRSGNIILATGLLSGWLIMRRLCNKTGLLAVGPSWWSAWLAPDGDFRQAPLAWALLSVAAAVLIWQVWRYGEGVVPAGSRAVSRNLKRVLPFSNVLAMAPLDLWWSRLADAGCRVGWIYLPRLLAILCISAVNTVLSLPERLLAPLLLKHRVNDPLFIVGVHRSGTTHLHNLLALDPRLCAPRNLHTLNPFGMLTTGWLITPLLGAFLTWRRPMDAMQMNLLTPQEEELAVAGMCHVSPYWACTFPRRTVHYERLIFPERLSAPEQSLWESRLVLFLRKLTFWRRRRPLLKSPYNTSRVAALRKLFPRAKFIHIHRHPYAVYRSNVHLAREGWVVFQLQDPPRHDCYESRFLANYRAMEDAFYRDAAKLPAEDVVEVCFEDLERDPLGVVRQLYAQLGLPLDSRFEQRLQDYVDTLSGYQKNRLPDLPPFERRQIDRHLSEYFERWGYSRDESPSVATRSKAA
jgi:hypothetical protein